MQNGTEKRKNIKYNMYDICTYSDKFSFVRLKNYFTSLFQLSVLRDNKKSAIISVK